MNRPSMEYQEAVASIDHIIESLEEKRKNVLHIAVESLEILLHVALQITPDMTAKILDLDKEILSFGGHLENLGNNLLDETNFQQALK